jgi:hypothetical protein
MKVAVVVGALVLLAPWQGRAQTVVTTTAADALFTEGQRLMQSGNYAEACRKLAESQKIEPAVGTELNLAVCLRNNGQLASAWSTFLAAVSSASQARQTERVEYARTQAAALEPRLGRLAVTAPSPRPGGLLVRVDGAELPEALWTTGLPIDAGEHVVEATAPGYQPTKQRITTSDQSTKTVVLAPMSRERDTSGEAPGQGMRPASGTSFVAAPEDRGSERTLAPLIGGLGLVALGVGGYFGLTARGQFDDSDPRCSARGICTPEGKALRDDARSSATIATVATGVGLGALAAAAVLWFTGSPSRTAAWPLRPELARDSVSVRGSF